MARLTKADRKTLADALRNAERAANYVFSDHIAVARVSNTATTTLDFKRECDDRTLYEVEREYGSDLCGLRNAIDILGHYLATH